MIRITLIIMMGLVLGCQRQSTPRIVPFDEVPPDLLQKAKEALPEVRFDNAVRRSDGGLEIRGKDPTGKVRDVDFSASGQLTEIE
ncbi:MAG: hypothetical protein ACKN85_04795 [Pirellula sp.]|nr:hypothetical protein [Planctomycetota bacterium]